VLKKGPIFLIQTISSLPKIDLGSFI